MFMQGDKVRVFGRRGASLGSKVGEVLAAVRNETGVYVVAFGDHGDPHKNAYVVTANDMYKASKQDIDRAEREAEAAAMAATKRKEKDDKNV